MTKRLLGSFLLLALSYFPSLSRWTWRCCQGWRALSVSFGVTSFLGLRLLELTSVTGDGGFGAAVKVDEGFWRRLRLGLGSGSGSRASGFRTYFFYFLAWGSKNILRGQVMADLALLSRVKKSVGDRADAEAVDEAAAAAAWRPPKGQTGDGRTSLSDKLGYWKRETKGMFVVIPGLLQCLMRCSVICDVILQLANERICLITLWNT